LSALLTTTMPVMKDVVELSGPRTRGSDQGHRGGAPVSMPGRADRCRTRTATTRRAPSNGFERRGGRPEDNAMKDLSTRLAAGDVLVGDGAWGTLLQAHGLRPAKRRRA